DDVVLHVALDPRVGSGLEDVADRDHAAELSVPRDDVDIVDELGAEVSLDVVERLAARSGDRDVEELRGHHSPGGVRVVLEELLDVAAILEIELGEDARL